MPLNYLNIVVCAVQRNSLALKPSELKVTSSSTQYEVKHFRRYHSPLIDDYFVGIQAAKSRCLWIVTLAFIAHECIDRHIT